MVLNDQVFIITRQKDRPTQNKHRYPILETTVIIGDFTLKIQPAGTYLYKEKVRQKMATIRFLSHPVPRRNLSFPNPPYSSRTLVQTIKPTMFFGHGKLSLCSINYTQCHQGVWSDTHFSALIITFVLYAGE